MFIVYNAVYYIDTLCLKRLDKCHYLIVISIRPAVIRLFVLELFATFEEFQNKMLQSESTICAPVNQPGSAICLIRVSGGDAISICEGIFTPRTKAKRLSEQPGFTVSFGEIKEDKEVIDEVLITIFRAPLSYTGEDMAEISCHGSSYIINKIIHLLISKGASVAAAGEFTRRAFMNGKMDLSQAEAVADLISSESEAAHKLAIQQLKGGFSEEIRELRSKLVDFASLIELELDFGEEDVEFADRSQLLETVREVRDMTSRLADSFSLGNAIKKGIPVAIAGRPNSGKSTLLNSLLNEERAIVSEIPGTTRDYIEDTMRLGAHLFRFIDTAGIRSTDDVVENLGISRSFAKIDEADIVLFVFDAQSDIKLLAESLEELRIKPAYRQKRVYVTINKSDIASEGKLKEFLALKLDPNEKMVLISAKNKTGISRLLEELPSFIDSRMEKLPDIIVTNTRHFVELQMVAESLTRVLDGFRDGLQTDLIAIDIRHAIHHLGEITGEISNDEILGNIFRNFCIGK